MVLQELTVTGFKSFPKKTELTFPSTVTAIVGPNGSGKSNIAEALRFVLGEQSVKSLRGKRGEDLIWGGTQQIAKANRASVSIQLNNESRVLPLDFDTITVERIVHRDGQNEYKINNQSVRLKDVQELLAAGNIGPTGHHIISQGEADRVLSASPVERRTMIEDALGLKVYQYKRSDAEKKLSKTKANIEEVTRLRKELAPHLAYLKRELDKQAEAKAVKIELIDNYAEYLKREDVYLAREYETITTKKTEAQAEYDQYSTTISELETELAKANSEEVTTEKETKLYQTWQELQKERIALEQELHTLQGKLSVITEQLNKSDEENKSNGDEVVAVQEVKKQLDEYNNKLKAVEKETDLETLQSVIQSVSQSIQGWLQSLVSDKKAAYPSHTIKQKEQLTKQVENIQATIDQTKDEETASQEAYEIEKQNRENARTTVNEVTKELYAQKTQATEVAAKVQQCSHELEVIARERDAFKEELQEAVALIGRAAAQYYSQPVCDADGKEITEEEICAEERQKQRDRKQALEKLKIRLETLGDGDSEDLETEYATTKSRDDFLASEISDLEESIKTLENLITDLETQIDEQFTNGFSKIQQEFQNFFTLMFGGGLAELKEVAENVDEDEEGAVKKGIDLQVRLPNKRVQGLTMLSGGERALTSIALVFAMSQINPPLFIVLDETDAALDEANSRRYGDLIEALAKRSQLVLITHNRETMSRAGILYGVTMGTSGASTLLSVQLEEAVQSAK